MPRTALSASSRFLRMRSRMAARAGICRSRRRPSWSTIRKISRESADRSGMSDAMRERLPSGAALRTYRRSFSPERMQRPMAASSSPSSCSPSLPSRGRTPSRSGKSNPGSSVPLSSICPESDGEGNPLFDIRRIAEDLLLAQTRSPHGAHAQSRKLLDDPGELQEGNGVLIHAAASVTHGPVSRSPAAPARSGGSSHSGPGGSPLFPRRRPRRTRAPPRGDRAGTRSPPCAE